MIPKVLFARIGYMEFYDGFRKGDEKPIGGGDYNNNNIGYEFFNFRNVNGKLYGYAQPKHQKEKYHDATINIKRIDPNCNNNFIDDVLVVFFASNINIKSQTIIGWYKNARVYRTVQKNVQNLNRDNNPYFFESNTNESILLPINERIPLFQKNNEKKGRPGQSNIFYLYDKGRYRNDEWIENTLTYVREYNGKNLLFEKSAIDIIDATNKFVEEYDTLSIEKTSQVLLIDSKLRKSIESYSMDKAKKYFQGKGFEVCDISKHESCDLYLKKNGVEYYVEVKGTVSSGNKIFLTPNEVEFNLNHKENMILYILHSIEIENDIPKGGVEYIQEHWIIEDCDLTIPIYQYTV